jgi:hypothetical protein
MNPATTSLAPRRDSTFASLGLIIYGVPSSLRAPTRGPRRSIGVLDVGYVIMHT